MRLLLDTHTLLWWLRDSPRLGQHARALIAQSSSDVMVSVVSPWEISIKHRVGKMEDLGSTVWAEIAAEGFRLLPIWKAHCVALEGLPQHHRDPFDHMLLAQAQVEGAAIITSDRDMTLYGIPCIPAMR